MAENSFPNGLARVPNRKDAGRVRHPLNLVCCSRMFVCTLQCACCTTGCCAIVSYRSFIVELRTIETTLFRERAVDGIGA
jgi:hypothetical protein